MLLSVADRATEFDGEIGDDFEYVRADVINVIPPYRAGAITRQRGIANACYCYIDDKEVVHIASVHAYDRAQKTMLTVPVSGGLSPAPSAGEAAYAGAWARNIWFDMLG